MLRALAAAYLFAFAAPLTIAADPPATAAAVTAPAWASASGTDKYGALADLKVGDAVQRFRWVQPGKFLMGSPEDEKGSPWRPGHAKDETQHEVVQGYGLADEDYMRQHRFLMDLALNGQIKAGKNVIGVRFGTSTCRVVAAEGGGRTQQDVCSCTPHPVRIEPATASVPSPHRNTGANHETIVHPPVAVYMHGCCGRSGRRCARRGERSLWPADRSRSRR